MDNSRRQLLIDAAQLMALASFPALTVASPSPPSASPPYKAQTKSRELWVSAQGASAGEFGLGWAAPSSAHANIHTNNTSGKIRSRFRGHGAAQHPRRKSVVMFARRPGRFGLEIDMSNGQILNEFRCADHRHMLGHGCFSKDGQWLFSSEADYRTGEGKIVVRDTDGYRIREEWPSYGIGPHEIRLMPDGNRLAVANGGILTHPDSGRKPLNLDSMQSSLTYIDTGSGKKTDVFYLPEPKASIRHLDVADDGTVAFATQLQRQAAGHDRVVPLGGVHKPGQALKLFTQPEALIGRMNDYMGSVAVNSHSRLAGFSSPRGDLVAFWHLDSGELAGYHSLRDVCGLATSVDQKHFVISNSFGQLRVLNATTLQELTAARQKLDNFRWDNHLLAIELA